MQFKTARRAWSLGSTVLAGVLAATALSGTVNAAAPSAPPAWTLTWRDDFSGSAKTGVSAADWIYDTGPGSLFGTGEIETMTNSTANVFEDGAGHLVLKAIHTGTEPTSGWTSGRLETQRADFGAPAGGVVMIESSIQQPNVPSGGGIGYWPTFWMLGAAFRSGGGWPKSGEIDILEDVNSASLEYGTLHCGIGSGGPCNETTGITSGARACSGCQDGYHTYAIQIDRSVAPEQIRWYLDGVNYFTVTSTQVDATTWANAVDHPFFIILDLAMGGGFPDTVCGCTSPTAATASGGQMNIDYVAVYNQAPAGSTGGAGSTLLSQGHPATASSIADPAFSASAAVDGDVSTRWASAFSDQQWIYVDLGATRSISSVVLAWEAEFGKSFRIQTSNDARRWTTIYSTTTGRGGTQTLNVSGSGRYVRMLGTRRGTPRGYSLWEFQVYGS